MRVHWSDLAKSELTCIESYIAKSSPRYAKAVIRRIVSKGRTLAKHPLIGAVVPERLGSGMREIHEGSYRIIYRIVDGGVHVLSVVHASRQFPLDL
jgi:toxin ParE1/3/4